MQGANDDDGVIARALELVEVAEVDRLLASGRGPAVFTPAEEAWARRRSDPERRLAARLAAKRATLFGSFSSRSPRALGSARASSRSSSERTRVKRDIRRSRRWPPHRGQTGIPGLLMLRTSRLTRRRQSWQ